METNAGVPFRNSLEPDKKKRTGAYRENMVPCTHPLYLTAEFPINQISNPDWFVWKFVEDDVAKAEVSMKCPSL